MSDYYRIGRTTDVQHPNRPVPRVSETAEPIREYSVGNVGRYLSAESSLHLYGPVPDAVFESRKAACLACPKRTLSAKVPDRIGFCGKCGCGVSVRSALSVKLTMPATTCPLGHFGASHGRHRRIWDRLKAWVVRRLIGAAERPAKAAPAPVAPEAATEPPTPPAAS